MAGQADPRPGAGRADRVFDRNSSIPPGDPRTRSSRPSPGRALAGTVGNPAAGRPSPGRPRTSARGPTTKAVPRQSRRLRTQELPLGTRCVRERELRREPDRGVWSTPRSVMRLRPPGDRGWTAPGGCPDPRPRRHPARIRSVAATSQSFGPGARPAVGPDALRCGCEADTSPDRNGRNIGPAMVWRADAECSPNDWRSPWTT
jgi:hypothetical protein